MNETRTPTCIYCDGPGPFSDEHVIPASIGADDKQWMLKGCVCWNCNTRVFSPLETKFARSSLFYLSRLALQPRSRNRGSKTEAPKAQLKDSFYFEPEVNRILEAVIDGGATGLVPQYLPQIHLAPDVPGSMRLEPSGPDRQSLDLFFDDLREALGESAVLIEKRAAVAEASYIVRHLRRAGDRYQVVSTSEETRPPAKAIWYAPLGPIRTYAASTGAMITPRIFRHESGSLTCRTGDPEGAIVMLGVVADGVQELAVPDGATTTSTNAPAYRQTIQFEPEAYCRVLAKIGLNIIAKTSGLGVVGQRHFDRARTYVLHGKPRLLTRSGGEDRIPESLLALAQERHLIGIEVERRLGMEAIRAIFKLYGGPAHRIRLASICGGTIGVTSVWLSVDYVGHRVERH